MTTQRAFFPPRNEGFWCKMNNAEKLTVRCTNVGFAVFRNNYRDVSLALTWCKHDNCLNPMDLLQESS